LLRCGASLTNADTDATFSPAQPKTPETLSMSHDDRAKDTARDDELQNLPERPVTDASQVRGGATPLPVSPVPIPYPNVRPGATRTVEPCF
jgi:hypothetical protein